MVNSSSSFTSETDVQRSNAQMIEEGCVVRAGTERADAKIGTATDLLFLFRCLRLCQAARSERLPQRLLALWITDGTCDVIDKSFERVGSLSDTKGQMFFSHERSLSHLYN